MTRAIPQSAVDIVSRFEGCKLTAYLCPANVLTIGYGSTGPHVKPGMTITKGTAMLMLRDDMKTAVMKLYRFVKPAVIDGLTDAQYAAMISFVFNLGLKPTWGIVRNLNAGKLDLIPGEIMKFTRANGKVMRGLVNRRTAEVSLWNTAQPDDDEEDLPSSITRQPGVTPPVTDMKPVSKSKTFWTGGAVAGSGIVAAGQQIQALAAPQAANSDLIANLASFAAVLIVAGGIAIMIFRYLDAKAHR